MNFLRRDFLVREPMLFGSLVLLTVIFSALTHSYTSAYDRRRQALGTEWFERGLQELRQNRPTAAVEDFRTALLYAPRNWDYRLRLADALTRAGRTRQASDYYLSLWQSNPRNGTVNLQLARLSMASGDPSEAEHYFNGAIFGDWTESAAGNRREASVELINFYLERGDTGQAESQILILSANLPENSELHARVADLYSRAGDDQRALSQYRKALLFDARSPSATLGAGQAAFRMGDYHAAQEYLNRSLHLDNSNPSARQLLSVTQSVLLLNPYERGLSNSEKVRRSLRIFEVAGMRLQSCVNSLGPSAASPVAPLLEKWRRLKPAANFSFVRQHLDEAGRLFDFSADAENQVQQLCGQPSREDSALLALAQRRETKDE